MGAAVDETRSDVRALRAMYATTGKSKAEADAAVAHAFGPKTKVG